MEILATKLILKFFITLRRSVQKVVSRNWDVPKHENVRADQNYPMHDELALLLAGDHRLGAIKVIDAPIISPIHGFQEFL